MISNADSTRFFGECNKIGALTLSDSAGIFASSVFTHLCLLRNPGGYIFPFLQDLTVENGNTYLEGLALFASSSVQNLKISQVDKTHELSLATALKIFAVETTQLKTLHLENNALTLSSIKVITHFKDLHTLCLVNTIDKFEVALLELLGTIDGLVDFTFILTEDTIHYRSRSMINAEEERVRRAKEERERMEARKHTEAAEKERQKEYERLEMQRVAEETRSKMQKRPAQVSSAGVNERNTHIYAFGPLPPPDKFIFASKNPLALARKKKKLRKRAVAAALEQLTVSTSLSTSTIAAASHKGLSTSCQSVSSTPFPFTPASIATRPPDLVPTCSRKFYHSLKSLNLTAPISIIEDTLNLVTSSTLETTVIKFVKSDPSIRSNPTSVITKIAKSWSGSASEVVVDATELNDPDPGLWKDDARHLFQFPKLRRLELTGWTLAQRIAYSSNPQWFGPSMDPQMALQHLHLPSHAAASPLSFPELAIITRLLPNLLSLHCYCQWRWPTY